MLADFRTVLFIRTFIHTSSSSFVKETIILIVSFRYYIPTYENDTLLFGLPDDEDEVTVSQTPVIAEETKVDIQNSILRDVHIRSSLSVT